VLVMKGTREKDKETGDVPPVPKALQ
jgi:hypothetical protein